jgi:hypothetical protein
VFALDIVAPKVGQLLPQRVVVQHFSNRENLFHNYGNDGELLVHTVYRQGLV